MTAFLATVQVLLLALTFQAVPVLAADEVFDDHVISRAVFRDDTARRSLSDVLAADFVPVGGIFAGGYTRDAVWMRFVVRPAADGGPLVLRILPAYLNAITLYEPDPARPGGWRTQSSGNSMPWRNRAYAEVSLGFIIHPVAETTYYLRLQTVSNSLLNVEALPPVLAVQREVRSMLWQALYMAIIFWVILWALNDYLLTRDPVILSFMLVHLFYLLYLISIMGYLALLLPGQSGLPRITFWSITLAVLASIIFHRKLLLLSEVGRPGRWMLNAMVAVSLAALGLLLFGQQQTALKFNSLLVLLSGPLFFAAALMARGDAWPGRSTLRIFYGLQLLALTSYAVPVLGLAKASAWTLYGSLVYGLLSALMFGGLLHMRARRLLAQEAQSRLKLTLSEQQLASKREKLEEQERLTAMLAHELKNPLAAIRLNLDTLARENPGSQSVPRFRRIDRAMTDIAALVKRCMISNRIEQGTQSLQYETFEAVRLAEDCAQQHGLGERARVQAAAGPLRVRSDAQLLSVALGNLIDNALKYSPADSPIDIRLQPQPNAAGCAGIRFEVLNDAGPAGYPDPAHAFDKYFRGDQTRNLSGNGLGLFLVKGVAGHLGGEVMYARREDRICFSLWIPETPP